MPQNGQPTLASDVWADQLIDAYKTPEGRAAIALDNLIDKLEKKSAELNEKMDKENILLKDVIDGELKTAKILRDRCIDIAEKRAKKSAEEKKALKDARLASGYHLASVKMFSQLANPGLETEIIGISPSGVFTQEYHAIFDEYVKEIKDISLPLFKRFQEAARAEGIEVREKDLETAAGEFEVWDFTKSKKSENDAEPKDEEFAASFTAHT